MNILLPLYPTNATERALLPETLRRAPLLQELAALGGPPPEWRMLAVAADPALLDIVAASGVRCRRLDIAPEPDSCDFLPHGTSAALELALALAQTEELAEDHAADQAADQADDALWCVLDLSAPLPGAPTLEAVDRALRLFEQEAPLAVASVGVVDDHPAQLDAYYRLLDVELLELLEPDAGCDGDCEGGRWLRSAPQFVEWEAFGADQPEEGQLYALVPGADSWRLRPERFGPQDPLPDTDGVLLLSAGLGLARRVTSAEALRVAPDRVACAVPLLKPLFESSCLLLRESSAEVGLYLREPAGEAEPLLRVWPMGDRKLLPVPPLESNRKPFGPETRTLCAGDTRFAGPVLRFALPEGTDALAVAVLERASGGDVDFMEPLESPPAGPGAQDFWQVDKATKQRSNALTGKAITGRQDFYPLYEFDRALCLFRARDFHNLADGAEQGRVAGLVLSAPDGPEGEKDR